MRIILVFYFAVLLRVISNAVLLKFIREVRLFTWSPSGITNNEEPQKTVPRGRGRVHPLQIASRISMENLGGVRTPIAARGTDFFSSRQALRGVLAVPYSRLNVDDCPTERLYELAGRADAVLFVDRENQYMQ